MIETLSAKPQPNVNCVVESLGSEGSTKTMATIGQRDNETIARLICERSEYRGRRFERGSFVAIAHGDILGVGRSFEEAEAYLESAGIEPGEGVVCQVVEPVIDVIR